MPHCELCSCLGFANFPSRPIGEFNLRRCDRVDAYVKRLSTCETPALVPAAFACPQFPVPREYFRPLISEQASKQRTSKVQPLVPVMIPIILRPSAECTKQKPVNDIPEIVRFPGFTILSSTNMRKHFLLEYLLCILDPLCSCCTNSGSSFTNVIQRNLLVLKHKCFFQRRPKQIHHLAILKVIAYMLQYILISNKS